MLRKVVLKLVKLIFFKFSFVKPENLGSHSKIKCDNCGTYEESTKQLTLRKLPIVACFHLKRFEHTLAARRQKIKDPVKYPEFIDLTPYTTAYRNSKAMMSDLALGVGGNNNSECTSIKHLAQLTNRFFILNKINKFLKRVNSVKNIKIN